MIVEDDDTVRSVKMIFQKVWNNPLSIKSFEGACTISHKLRSYVLPTDID